MRPVNPIGTPFILLGEVDSSNNYAMRQIQAQLADHGTAFFATHQTQGKGQWGKKWNAQSGENIILSCVLKPDFINIDNQFVLIASIALACQDFFKSYAGDTTKIKWPNDIYWGDRKAGGILLESILQGPEWKYTVAGIGININQTFFSADLPNPVSLKQITGKTFNPVELAKELCVHIQNRWDLLVKPDMHSIFKTYNENLYKNGEVVHLRKNTTVFSAVIKGVNDRGELVVDSSEITSPITFGSVEWLIA